MTSQRKYREVECFISEGNLQDIVASFLIATGYVHDNEELVTMDLGPEKNGVRPLKFKVIKLKEVRVRIEDG